MDAFNERLKELREEAGLTQDALARGGPDGFASASG
jgi:DNA-binding XRE family transcriptional regulator